MIDFPQLLIYYVHMSPRNKKETIQNYRPVLSVEARDALTELAEALGFVVTRHGTYEGLPSVPDLLEGLAAAYRHDPDNIRLMFTANGVHNLASHG